MINVDFLWRFITRGAMMIMCLSARPSFTATYFLESCQTVHEAPSLLVRNICPRSGPRLTKSTRTPSPGAAQGFRRVGLASSRRVFLVLCFNRSRLTRSLTMSLSPLAQRNPSCHRPCGIEYEILHVVIRSCVTRSASFRVTNVSSSIPPDNLRF